MAEPAPPSSSVFNTLNIDLLFRVAEYTFLNPLFAVWTPLVPLMQGYSTASAPFQLSLAYVGGILALTFVSFTSRAWLNQSWRSSSPFTALFGGPTLEWAKQIVVVTGGAGGIGLVLCETLAMMGATVVIVDRETVELARDDMYSFKCDLANESEIVAISKKIQREVGRPTILIQNAGMVQGKLIVDLTAEEASRSFAVNVLAQFSLLRLFLPDMIKKRRGHIVTVSSVFGLAAAAQLSEYCASKHALVGLHETLRSELKYRHGDPPVRTTLVCPGRVATPLFATLAAPSPAVAFIAPTVEPYVIAKAIVAALETEQSREIYLPRYGAFLWTVRGMPSYLKHMLEWVTGANDAMKPWAPPPRSEQKSKDA